MGEGALHDAVLRSVGLDGHQSLPEHFVPFDVPRAQRVAHREAGFAVAARGAVLSEEAYLAGGDLAGRAAAFPAADGLAHAQVALALFRTQLDAASLAGAVRNAADLPKLGFDLIGKHVCFDAAVILASRRALLVMHLPSMKLRLSLRKIADP